jgi:hypothetical protein
LRVIHISKLDAEGLQLIVLIKPDRDTRINIGGEGRLGVGHGDPRFGGVLCRVGYAAGCTFVTEIALAWPTPPIKFAAAVPLGWHRLGGGGDGAAFVAWQSVITQQCQLVI